MKKRAASLALVLSMILSFTCQAGAVDAKTETQLDAVKKHSRGCRYAGKAVPEW